MENLHAPSLSRIHVGYYESEHPSTVSTPFVSAPSSPGRNPGMGGFYFSAPPSPSWGTSSIEDAQRAGYSPAAAMAVAGSPARKSESGLDDYTVEGGRNAGYLPTGLALAMRIPGSVTRKSEGSEVDDHSPHSLTGSDFEFSARFLQLEEPPMSPTPMCSASGLFGNGQIRASSAPPHLEETFSSVRQLIAADGSSLDCPPSASCVATAPQYPPSLKHEERGVNTGNISNLYQEVFDPSATVVAEMGKTHSENSHRGTRSFLPFKMFNSDEMATKLSMPEKAAELANKAEKKLNKRSRKWTLRGLLHRSGGDVTAQSQDSSRRWSDACSSRQSSRGSRRSESSQSSIEWEKDRSKSTLDSQGSSKSKASNGIATGVKSFGRPSTPHELHYAKHRAQTEEMKRKTFLPYRQGLLGCLGFSSKSYQAMTNISSALQPVS